MKVNKPLLGLGAACALGVGPAVMPAQASPENPVIALSSRLLKKSKPESSPLWMLGVPDEAASGARWPPIRSQRMIAANPRLQIHVAEQFARSIVITAHASVSESLRRQ